MRSCHTAPTDRRAEPGLRPIYPPRASSDGVRRQRELTAGFPLLEIVAVVAIVAMLAAVLLPLAPRGTSRQRLAAYAVEAAALLKVDRSEEHTSELQSPDHLVCRLLLEKKKNTQILELTTSKRGMSAP